MRAVQLSPAGVKVHADFPVPTPQSGEVLVRVLQAGICETDLQLMRGYMGFQGVLGHEFVGIAEAGQHRGQRVVGEINCSCHQCPTCLSGMSSHCPHRTVLGILGHDGAFANYIAVPERNLHVIPDGVSNDEAVFVEPLAAAFQIPTQVPLSTGPSVVVLGDGRLGQLCAQVLALHKVSLLVIGKHSEKLELLSRRGVQTALVDDVTDQRFADVVVDCTGSANGVRWAMTLLKPRGTLVLKTTVAGEPPLSLAPIVIDELRIIGSRCGPFPPAIAALANKSIDVKPLIQARYPLDQATTALERVANTSILKVLLDVAR